MKVQKRNGVYEDVSFDKVIRRITLLCIKGVYGKKLNLDSSIIAQKVCSEIYDGVRTTELDELSSQVSISMYSKDPNYGELSSRIIISNHQKETSDLFSDVINELYENNIIQDYLYNIVKKNKDIINERINHYNDFKLDYFGFKTLEKSYLLKSNGRIIERPQYLFMRVALCIHRNDLDLVFDTYDKLSNKEIIHATPTLFNAGTKKEQLASCFLLSMKDDSVTGIYDTLKDCALISQSAGGIGIHIHNIRGNGSYINGTNGKSNGIIPMLRVFNDTARYIDQGGGKRNGSFAIYLEPWHCDIFEFLELKKNHGNEMERARDLFYGLWIPDLFMKKVHDDDEWCLFCPNECKGLSDCYGDEFEKLYQEYENGGRYRRRVNARELWYSILNSQIETGTPYLLYKDSCNGKSNQKNLGIIKSSNLCTEIIEYSDKDETAVCNLASISLPSCLRYKDYKGVTLIIYTKFNCRDCLYTKGLCKLNDIKYDEIDYRELDLSDDQLPRTITFPQIYNNDEYIGGYFDLVEYLKPEFDYLQLKNLSKILTINLNKIIDYNYYPIPEAQKSNFRHRPIGIGVQGLANVFYEMKIGFGSSESKSINERIFEAIYYGSLESSMEIAKERETIVSEYKRSKNDGVIDIDNKYNILKEEYIRDEYLGTYSTYIGSPMYHNQLQFDLWGYNQTDINFNWTKLRENIKKHGIRNSLLVAPMPTASTSQILGNYECFEPIISNIYTRRVLAGEYMVINEYLVNDLISINKWDEEIKDKIIKDDGSILDIDEIPDFIKCRYKTAWEIKQKDIIDMSCDRGKYICQSQSLNLFISSPNYKILSSMHFYGWNKGLKTGMYYLRTRPSSKPIQFTIEPDKTCISCSG